MNESFGVNDPVPEYTGVVDWFNGKKGYGFIISDSSGEHIFVHFTGIVGSGYRVLSQGQKVIFELGRSPKGPIAVNVRVLTIRPEVYERWINRLNFDVLRLRNNIKNENKKPKENENQVNTCKAFLENILGQAYLHQVYLTTEDETKLYKIKGDLEYVVQELEKKRSSWWKSVISAALLFIGVVADLVTLISPATGLLLKGLASKAERLLGSGGSLFLNPRSESNNE